ncbi:MAG: hypothetical protein ABI675_20450 [Chitinophagaceae bacterium]
MRNLRRNIYSLLSNKKAAVFIIPFCIISKSVLIFFYSYIGKDKIYSLSASYNLLHGKGWTNSFYYLDNLNKEVLLPFCYWPPGYGLLMSPFQKIFGQNIFLGTTIFEVICFIIFILLCRVILKTQQLPVGWLNISTILLSFFSHEFIETSLGTDLPALCFVLGFFYCCIRVWDSKRHRKIIKHSIIAGLCLFFAGFIRYMYVPVCLFIAVLLIILSYWKRNKEAQKGYWISFAICLLLMMAAMIFQDMACGSPFYTGIDKKGIFIDNLSYWYPSAIAAFVNINLVAVQLGKNSSITYLAWQQLFSWINLLLYLLIVIAASKYFYPYRKRADAGFPVFSFIGFVLSAAIIGELAILSLTHFVKPTSGGVWTFIVEGRYQAFPVVFLQLFFLTKVAKAGSLLKFKPSSSFIISFLFVLFLLNFIHQVYYTAKVAGNYRSMKNGAVREQDYAFFESLLKSTIKDNPEKDILVASSDRYYPLLASMLNKKGIACEDKLNNNIPAVSKPSILFTVIFDTESDKYANYLSNSGVKLVTEVAGTKIYKQILNP